LAADNLDPETGMFGPLDRMKLDEASDHRRVKVWSFDWVRVSVTLEQLYIHMITLHAQRGLNTKTPPFCPNS